MRYRGYLRASAAMIVAGLLISTAANAQEAQPAEDQNTADQGGDIIVTATRSETYLSKTPVAISAVTGDTLRAQGITNPTALADSVPNISIDRSNGLQITIRGVTSTDGTEKGDPSAAFMLDGIYIARPQVQEVSFYDVQRVEVLRGPQGTLYGRNTTAGLVNVIANKPNYDSIGGTVDVGYGNYNAFQATGALNLPVGENFALRAAVNYDQRDSYLIEGTGVTQSFDPYKKNLSVRLSAAMRWDSGELVLRGDYSDIGGQTFNTPSASAAYSFPSGPTAIGVTPLSIGNSRSSTELRTINTPLTASLARNNSTWGIMADLRQDIGPVTVSYLGSYREFTRDEDGVTVRALGAATRPTTFDGKYWQQSHELRIATNGTGPLKAQAGAYYFQEQSAIAFYLYGVLNPNPGTTGYIFGFPQDPTKAKSYAAFAQLTYELTPELRVTGGIRYSKDDKSRIGFTVTCGSLSCNLPTDTKQTNNAARKFSKTTWRLGLDYDLDDRSLLYATVSTGYKAGGFNDGCVAAVTPGCNVDRTESALYYEPETLTSYEMGLKTRLLDNALRLTLSAFHYDYKNLQLSQIIVCTPTGGICQNTQNAAQAKVDGVEFEATIQPGPNDRFDFGVNYLDAHYSNYVPLYTINTVLTPISFNGRQLDRSPNWTATAGYQHTFELGDASNVQLGVRTRMSDSYQLTSGAQGVQYRQPGYTKTDVTITYNAPDNRWYVQGFAKNLEDKVVVTSIAATIGGPNLNASIQLGDPRTFGVRAGMKF